MDDLVRNICISHRPNIRVFFFFVTTVFLFGLATYYRNRQPDGQVTDAIIPISVRKVGNSHHQSQEMHQSQQGPVTPTRVLLFCYRRGGSTFLSEYFRQNPNATYWYEPLDLFYVNEAGFHVWNKPEYVVGSDDRLTPRKLPTWEKNGVRDYSLDLLSCNVSALPNNLFSHPLIGKSSDDLRRVKSSVIPTSRSMTFCQKDRECSQSPFPTDRCHKKTVYNAKIARKKISTDALVLDKRLYSHQLVERTKCFDMLAQNVAVSASKFSCDGRDLVVFKGLRLTMEIVSEILAKDPGVHVVYYVRDPRAIITSRNSQEKIRDLKRLVLQMTEDIKMYKRLKQMYSGFINFFRYEDLVMDPISTSRKIYKSFGKDIPVEVIDWIHAQKNVTKDGHSQSTARQNSTEHIDQWKTLYSPSTRTQMFEIVQEFLVLAGYKLEE